RRHLSHYGFLVIEIQTQGLSSFQVNMRRKIPPRPRRPESGALPTRAKTHADQLSCSGNTVCVESEGRGVKGEE
ncbi:MAG: hypothetical protein KBG41_09460, partial [Thiobacillaceae bacterium]|nr:hypothetical protein [Thiobacillaceae bacterium]